MDANDILLWLGVSMLAVWVLQLVGQLRMLRAQAGPAQVGVPALLVLVLVIAALGLVSWLLLRAWSGWILVGMEAAVTLPSLFLQLAVEAFEEQRLALALRWAGLSAALMPLPFHRGQVRLLRAMIAILRGEEGPLPAGQAGQGGTGRESVSQSSAQDSLQLFRWSVAGRWQEIATAIAALPQQGEPVRITLARLRSSYEIHEFEAALAAYARLQGLEALPQRGAQRMVQGSRLLLLAAAGEEAAVGSISAALGYSAERRDGIMAWAAWAAGDESGARARLTALAQSQDPVIRTTALVRISAPPPPASILPPRWRELARALAADPSWAVRRRARAVQALVAVNAAVFAITCSLAMSSGAVGGGGGGASGADGAAGADDDLNQTLIGMGALITPVAHGQEWRLLTSLFLHANVLHLVMNMLGLVAIGPRIERALGWLRFTALYLISGLGGNLVFDMADTLRGGRNELVGASGCIMGVCGALVVESAIEFRRNREAGWPRLRMLMFLLVLQWLFDASHPEVAALAHLGGLAIGAACAWWMLPHPPAPPVAAAAGDGR